MAESHNSEPAQTTSTAPKPFVFVLIPFDPQFNDVYKFGIKGAADDVGAYAEHVGEQIFAEGILDRIFNQINKADVIVADMTGRNPNVFYEVGYAHALGRVVVLLTQRAEDIPFDLKHRAHIVYGASIEKLRGELGKRLTWAITESKRLGASQPKIPFALAIAGQRVLPSRGPTPEIATITYQQGLDPEFIVEVCVENTSSRILQSMDHLYLFSNLDSLPLQTVTQPVTYISPMLLQAEDATDGLNYRYRLDAFVRFTPPGAVEQVYLRFYLRAVPDRLDAPLRLRLHHENGFADYAFRLQLAAAEDNESQQRRALGPS